jgi:hypothetical protein
MAMEEDIVVIGTRLRDEYQFDWFWRDWLDTGFGNYYTDGGGGGGSYVTIDQVATEPTNDYTIPATSRMPKIELRDLTQAQFETFMEAYDNVANDPELAAQFQQLATNGVTLTLTVSDQLPPNAHPDARATITFTPVAGDFQGNNESVMPNTEVEIVVNGTKIRDDLTWEDTFEGIIAHEFTHLLRDSNGRYLDDHIGDGWTGETTYDRDDETYDNLFGANSLSSYSNSLDIVSSVDEFGLRSFTGTDGNNHISMFGTDGFAAFTGAGNDMVIGQTGMDLIYVTGAGKKAIVEPGTGYDMIVMSTIDSISKVVLTYSGSDLYITSSDSTYAPLDDPNAVVVIGQTLNSSQNAVETIAAADMFSIDVYPFGAASSAPAADQTLALEPKGELPALLDEMSIFTADLAIPETSLGRAFYIGDSSPTALYEFMMERAPLDIVPEVVWVG